MSGWICPAWCPGVSFQRWESAGTWWRCPHTLLGGLPLFSSSPRSSLSSVLCRSQLRRKFLKLDINFDGNIPFISPRPRTLLNTPGYLEARSSSPRIMSSPTSVTRSSRFSLAIVSRTASSKISLDFSPTQVLNILSCRQLYTLVITKDFEEFTFLIRYKQKSFYFYTSNCIMLNIFSGEIPRYQHNNCITLLYMNTNLMEYILRLIYTWPHVWEPGPSCGRARQPTSS